MIVNIKYFGLLADVTKKKEEQISIIESTISVAFLKSKIESIYQELQKSNYSIAVNQVMANANTSLKENDVIAFLPPFAGG